MKQISKVLNSGGTKTQKTFTFWTPKNLLFLFEDNFPHLRGDLQVLSYSFREGKYRHQDVEIHPPGTCRRGKKQCVFSGKYQKLWHFVCGDMLVYQECTIKYDGMVEIHRPKHEHFDLLNPKNVFRWLHPFQRWSSGSMVYHPGCIGQSDLPFFFWEAKIQNFQISIHLVEIMYGDFTKLCFHPKWWWFSTGNLL